MLFGEGLLLEGLDFLLEVFGKGARFVGLEPELVHFLVRGSAWSSWRA